MVPVTVYTSEALFALPYRENDKDTYSEAPDKIFTRYFTTYDEFIDVTAPDWLTS